MGFRANFSRISSMLFVDNLRCIDDLIHGGVCHRFPDLKLVSVESGVGVIPGALEAFDWQWRNGGVAKEHPEMELLPSEYFRRQIYGCFWYEREHVVPGAARLSGQHAVRDRLPAPDLPAPRSPDAGGRAVAPTPRTRSASLPDDVLEKVLGGTARGLYGAVVKDALPGVDRRGGRRGRS